jgi:signal transduction histidine kinase
MLLQLEAGKMKMESEVLDLRDLVEQVVGMMSSIMYKKPISITTRFGHPLPRYFVSDGLRLKQVLVNLCTNAIKFTKQGKITVKVSMVSAQQKDEAVTLAAAVLRVRFSCYPYSYH